MVGVLALQGGFASHCAVFASLGVETREVRTVQELAACDRLVIPGGESTVLTRLLGYGEGPALRAGIAEFAKERAVMGTCAGLIMLSRKLADPRVETFGLLDVSVERNGWGRQTESSIMGVRLDVPERDGAVNAAVTTEPYAATFIRAPRIREVGDGVDVVGILDSGEPVMVRQGRILGLTFHPELTPNDARIHEYFLSL
jgi:5'-phosphate synthase pdxT subunit